MSDKITREEAKLAWAAWIDALLQRTEISAAQLAAAIGVSQQLMSFWRRENHNRMPTEEQQAKLIEFAQKQGWVA